MLTFFSRWTNSPARSARLGLCTVLCIFSCVVSWIASTSMAQAAPDSELIAQWNRADANNTQRIDHSLWQNILADYVVRDELSDINLVDYAALQGDRSGIDAYVAQLGVIDPRDYALAEQQAYWINLYNAATVQLILDNLPVESITDIKDGFFSFGPWDKEWIKVAGATISLNDIEHGILRPIWQDERIHYAVNCASFGCPNLSLTAFTADNMESLLEQAASDFINHPRGLSVDGNKVIFSSIYHWYKIDFGDSNQGLLKHWQQYANADLAQQLAAIESALQAKQPVRFDHQYDWQLNEAD